MTPQQIFAIGLRLFALWLLATSLKYLVWTPHALIQYSEGRGVEMSVYIGVGMLALAIVLWLFPLWIAHRFVPRTKFENALKLQPLEAARVGCALIGLWFFANGLLNLAWDGLMYTVLNSSESTFGALPGDEKTRVAYAIVQVVLALVLVLRASTFARLVVGEAKA
jgi:hypothetical protein